MSQFPVLSAPPPVPYTIGVGAFVVAPTGILRSDAQLGDASATLDVVDPPEGHVARCAVDDVLRIHGPGFAQSPAGDSAVTVASDFWSAGAIPSSQLVDVWLRVTAVKDNGTHFSYTVTKIQGPAAQFPAGTRWANYGPATNRVVQLQASRQDTPQIDVLATGAEPWTNTAGQVRIGRLGDLAAAQGALTGVAVGQNLNDKDSPYAALTEQGLRLSKSALAIGTGAVVTLSAEPNGALRLGPDVTKTQSVDLFYDSANRSLYVRTLRLGSALALSEQVELRTGNTPTVRLSPNGSVRFGTDVSTDAATGFFYDTTSGRLTLNAAAVFNKPTTFGAATTFNDVVTVDGAIKLNGAAAFNEPATFGAATTFSDVVTADGAVTLNGAAAFNKPATFGAATVFRDVATLDGLVTLNGAASFKEAATFSGETTFEAEGTINSTLRAVNDGRFVVGANEDILLDRQGITLRLKPGENNAVKVLGIGRAALLNAYQTAANIQQFDVLAYSNRGVPSVHGSLRLGVAGVDEGEPDVYVRILRYNTGPRRIEAVASVIELQADTLEVRADLSVDGGFEFNGSGDAARIFQLRNLPIRAAGLPSGAVWNDGGVLKIVL